MMTIERWNEYAREYNLRASQQIGNRPDDFENLTEEEQHQLCDWVNMNFSKIKSINRRMSTYGLKHIFESYNFYITNGQMKGALLKCGFKTVTTRSGVNWFVNVSQRDITRLTKDRTLA